MLQQLPLHQMNYKLKRTLFTGLLACALSFAHIFASSAQIRIIERTLKDSARTRKSDSVLVKKNFGHAAFQFALAELVPQSFDQYVTKKDYAQISFKTIGHNLNPGSWQFDNDPLQTNQIGRAHV